ncbi:MAG: hypothetical protein HC859_07225 [Bacteroidia bacterium]|nr:hypothetical protein [Bacteroidia bacterium]
MEGVTVADWQAYINITGPFTGSSGGSASSMFYYDEPAGGWVAYPASGGNNTAPIQKGVGYSTYLYNGTNPITIEVAGNPYQGDHSFILDPGTGGGASDGWNLLGNPYASPILWNTAGWNRSGIGNTASVRDNPSGQFVYWDAVSGVGSLPGGRIAPGQAFWVQTLNSSPSLTIHESAKADAQTALYRDGNQPSANFFTAVLSNASFEDPAYIILSPDGTDDYDKLVDAVKRPNTLFNLSTLAADETPLAINKTSDSFCTKEVRLNIQNVTAGTYTLSFQDLDQLKGIQSMIFRDNYTNASFDIKATNSYQFQVTTDAATFGSNRFAITLTRENIDTTPQLSASDLCGGSNLTVSLDTHKAAYNTTSSIAPAK